jgi:hypothetical protein
MNKIYQSIVNTSITHLVHVECSNEVEAKECAEVIVKKELKELALKVLESDTEALAYLGPFDDYADLKDTGEVTIEKGAIAHLRRMQAEAAFN